MVSIWLLLEWTKPFASGTRPSDVPARVNGDGRIRFVGRVVPGRSPPRVGRRNGLKVWDAASGQVLHDDAIDGAQAVAWSPDGKRLALGTGAGNCILYRTADWSEAVRWDGHIGGVKCVAWDPHGSRLASAGADSLVRVWDPDDGTCLLTLRGHLTQATAVAWDPSGHRLVSAGMDGTVKVWPMPPIPSPAAWPVARAESRRSPGATSPVSCGRSTPRTERSPIGTRRRDCAGDRRRFPAGHWGVSPPEASC